MTIDIGIPDTENDAPTPLPKRAQRSIGVIVAYWLVLLAGLIVAFYPTWVRLVDEAADGAITTYIFVLPFLAAVAAQGIARRRSGELPIHDRQTDIIVGGLVLLTAFAIKALWLPRYADQYELVHLDVLAGLVFFLGGTILLFGLRPVGRFWSVWLLLLSLSPLLYRMAAITVGGSRFAYGAVLVVLAGAAGAIAVGRTRRRGWLGFVCTVIAGFAILAVMLAGWPGAHISMLQLIPTVGAAATTGIVFYFVARRGKSKSPLSDRIAPVTAKRSVSSVVVVGLSALVLLIVPLPDQTAIAGTPGPPGTELTVPDGWAQNGVEEFSWAKTYFGRTATLTRQEMRANEGNPAWDIDSRPRTVVVDSLSTVNRASLAVYPESTLYRLGNTRTSNALSVDLGHDVTAALYTSVSDALLLTWTKLVYTWVRGDVTQRVTVISVDNHEADAVFPQPAPSMASNLRTGFATFLRGNAIAVDNNPDYKDRELLTAFGTALVAEQWDAS
ncbi:hypothetical protein QMK17_12115 [Rhodococcus sp. G-MC3]|uniref:hypothetical protein n=1 Tax=Rhodococcus sp. G-MC3 TaxID=3046209 RepID=UPI0024B958CF|nr:hypothetical protein [Rhodococcus sp. G-MC3]MDJ0394073.1 hypothetical protein [Rhodococcus sp. G-MC3]